MCPKVSQWDTQVVDAWDTTFTILWMGLAAVEWRNGMDLVAAWMKEIHVRLKENYYVGKSFSVLFLERLDWRIAQEHS